MDATFDEVVQMPALSQSWDPQLRGTSRMLEKVGATNKKLDEAQEALASDVTRTARSNNLLNKLHQKNASMLATQLKDHAKFQELVAKDYAALPDLVRRVGAGEKLSGKEAKEYGQLLAAQKEMTQILQDSQLSMSIRVKDITDDMRTRMLDPNIDLGEKRNIIASYKSTLKTAGLEKDEMKEVNTFDEDTFNATQEQTEAFLILVDKLSDRTDSLEIQGKLEDIRKLTAAGVMSSQDIEAVMERQEALNKKRSGATQLRGLMSGRGGKGALDMALAAAGLGGLGDSLLEMLAMGSMGLSGLKTVGGWGKKMGKKIGGTRAGKAIGRGARGAGRVGRGMMRGAGMLARGVGIAGGLVGGATGAMDGEEITGQAGASAKMGGAGAGILSGLTLGLIPPELIYKFAENTVGKIMDYFFDGLLFVYEKWKSFDFAKAWEKITTWFKDVFAEDGVMGYVKKAASFVTNPIGTVVDAVVPTSVKDKVASILPQGVQDYFGIGKAKKTDTGDVVVDLLKRVEGFRGETYKDEAGISTIGYGHARPTKETMSKYDTDGDGKLSETEATELLKSDIAAHSSFKSRLKVPITPEQDAAMMSLAFNAGPGALNSMVDLMNQGKTQEAANKFLEYNKITDPTTKKKVASEGLMKRRISERQLFLGELKPATTGIAREVAQAKPATLSTQSVEASAQLDNEARAAARATRQQAPRISVPQAKAPPQATNTRAFVDTPELLLMNSIALEG